ncbi:Protein phosphatase [Psidium guajava]|nr:Protein phosphatase [Psidium guajava]
MGRCSQDEVGDAQFHKYPPIRSSSCFCISFGVQWCSLNRRQW